MKRGIQGRLILSRTPGESFHSYVPDPLPPVPPLELDASLYDLLEGANRALGRLDGVAMLLPDISLFLYFYVRKEAVLSSQIEGTQSSLSDLLLFETAEIPGVPLDDVQEVSSYVAAMELGMQRIREGKPLVGRLLREIHAVLLGTGRGSVKQPGEFRHSQNWFGGTRPGTALFVPAPPDEVLPCLSEFEKFLHDTEGRTPTLIKAALAHVQFETIHPFLDGNGRLGRLLITLLLCYEEAMNGPLLYLSLYFKRHKSLYYDLLQRVRMEGDWEEWLRFFLEGVQVTANGAADTARRILQLFEADRKRIETLGRAAASTLRLHHLLQRTPLVSVTGVADGLGVTPPTAAMALRHLAGLDIVHPAGDRRRNRLFVYSAYLDILNEGMEPLP